MRILNKKIWPIVVNVESLDIADEQWLDDTVGPNNWYLLADEMSYYNSKMTIAFKREQDAALFSLKVL